MTNKIPLYQVRSFSDKFSATFDFVRQNWRLFVRLSIYLLLPLSIIQGIFSDSYYSDAFTDVFTASRSDYSGTPWSSVIVIMVVSFLTTMMIVSMTYAIMKRYEQDDENINLLTLKDLLPAIKHNFRKSFVALLTYAAVYVVLLLIFSFLIGFATFTDPALSVILVLVATAASVAIFPPMMLLLPIYLLEDDAKLWNSLKKAFVYGFKTWGGLFALLFVIGIIVGAASYFVMIPGIVIAALKSSLFPATFTGSGIMHLAYTVLQDILTIIGLYFAGLFMSVPLIAVAYHYGHAAEVLDSVTVDGEIEHFDELADKGEDEDIDNFNDL